MRIVILICALFSVSAYATPDMIFKKAVSGDSKTTCEEASKSLDSKLSEYKSMKSVIKIEIDPCKSGPIPWDDGDEWQRWQTATVHIKVQSALETQ